MPQARTFIERICKMWPEKIIAVRDKFFDIKNPRGYRDAKMVLNMGQNGQIIPMEIICQVRTFFEFEHQTHGAYEKSRRAETKKTKVAGEIENKTETLHIEGVKRCDMRLCGRFV